MACSGPRGYNGLNGLPSTSLGCQCEYGAGEAKLSQTVSKGELAIQETGMQTFTQHKQPHAIATT